MNQNQFHMLYDFTDRTVLITGGAGVLGNEIARMLVECNANVAILSRNAERGEKSIAEINKDIKSNGHAIYVHGDVVKIDTLQQANEAIQSQFGHVDILINAVGGNHPSATTSTDLSFFDLPLDALHHVGDLNLPGTILPSQVFGRGMAERGEGVMDAKRGIENPNVRVTLASKISAEDCARLNLGYLDPAKIDIKDWRDRENEGILYVPTAGEILYRMK